MDHHLLNYSYDNNSIANAHSILSGQINACLNLLEIEDVPVITKIESANI
jgi:hypothetical protein